MLSEAPGWSQTTLGSLCVIKARIGWRGLTASEYTDSGPLLIAGKHIHSGVIDWSACDHLSESRFDESPEIMLRQGDVVFSKDGSIGNPALIRALPGPATINGTMMMLRPDQNQIDPEFLFQFVNGAAFARMIAEKVSGSSIPHIFQRDIVHFPTALPPLEEQCRIAEVLRSVDEAVAVPQETCGAYDRIRAAEVEGFAHASLKNGTRPLESLIASMDSGWSPDCESEPARGDEWGVLKTTAVMWDGFNDRHNKRLPLDLCPRPALEVTPGDILITRAGPAERTGVVAIVKSTDGKRMLSDKLIRLRAAPDLIEPPALCDLLSSKFVQDEFRALKSGMAASQTNISQKALRGVSIQNASQDEQRAFVAKITNIDAALNGERQALSTMRGLQKSFSAELLSGRVRVPA